VVEYQVTRQAGFSLLFIFNFSSGQAGAVSLGLARALLDWAPEMRVTLRKGEQPSFSLLF
jgi:hypothetical protein